MHHGGMHVRATREGADIALRPPALPRVLLVEDDYFIAMDVAGALRKHGFEVVGPVGQKARALHLVAQQKLDFAILDVNLEGEMVFPVADALREAKVPFFFATGYGDDVIPPQYRDVPLCGKPFRSDDLVERLPGAMKDQLTRPANSGLCSPNVMLQQLGAAEAAALWPHLRRLTIGCGPLQDSGFVCFPEGGLCSLMLTPPDGRGAVEVAMVGLEGVVGAPLWPQRVALGFTPVWHAQTDVVAVPAEAFGAVIERSPHLQALLSGYLRALMVQMAWTIQASAALDLPHRLARWILMAADRVGGHIHVTHDELSRVLDVRRAGVTTSLHILEGEQWVRSKRGLISLRNRAALEAFVGSSYGEPEREYAAAVANWPPPPERRTS